MKAELPDLSLVRAHPRFAELAARKAEMESRLFAIREERIGLLEAVRDEQPSWIAHEAREPSPIQKAARALLGSILPQSPPAPAAIRTATATARMAELAEEEATLNAAIGLLAVPYAEARAEASAAVRAKVAPEIHDRARALAAAVCAMAEAGQHYMDLARAIDREGVSWGELTPITRLPGGLPGVPYSEVRQWLSDAVADGHLDAKALPREWREGLVAAA